ncbi:MAG: HD domain-containing protein [Oligoflexia bacterium]|nr:HD domain-containing protein [Oligoflexia bacterium]
MADELIPIPIETFRSATRDINFDVFLKLSDENVAHIFSKSTGVDYKRLAHYIQKGVTHLFIRAHDLAAYQAFVSRPAIEIFNDPNTTNEKKIATLLNMTEQNMAEIFVQLSVRDETVADTRKLIGNYVKVMGERPQSLALILKLASHADYLYYHSIAVSIFSLFIAKASGMFDRRLLELVGLGGFLHDIGSVQLPPEIMNSTEEFSTLEREEMRKHPKLGLEMLGETGEVPEEVRYIIYQHHEQPNGKGYPNGISGPTMYYPARIVGLADAFSALISRRPYREAYKPEMAIEILRKDPGKFDRHLVDMLASVILRQAPPAKKAG